MLFLQFSLIVLCLLALGAHFRRARNHVLLAATVIVLALLTVRQPWAARVVQGALVIGALEWFRTLRRLALRRAQMHKPLLRMAFIIGIVAAISLLSAIMFELEPLSRVYGIE